MEQARPGGGDKENQPQNSLVTRIQNSPLRKIKNSGRTQRILQLSAAVQEKNKVKYGSANKRKPENVQNEKPSSVSKARRHLDFSTASTSENTTTDR